MGLKEGLLLALVYLIPFALLMPPTSANTPGAVFLWFLWPIVSEIVLLAAILAGHHFFDVSLKWGLLLLLASPFLALLFSPIFSLVWGFYIVPTLLLFVTGLMEG